MRSVRIGLMGAVMISVLMAGGAQAEPLSGCAAKQAEIETNLAQARSEGRKGQIRGLEKALKEHREHCTDDGLRQEREEAVQQAREELRERQQDLREARVKGDQSKIRRREQKLAESQRELEQALEALRQ
ncbi:DUF1090 domain-containing protein [Alloalcanivorax mobilis]|uniref:DUF1090 domain-containing protein n=1 Tax=Alloalcanivorax mobilis TaxID=2019569 RepID=UPI000C776943|nr:DUF1090 domain-containing protein [Alloalcanivorax mobilis]